MNLLLLTTACTVLLGQTVAAFEPNVNADSCEGAVSSYLYSDLEAGSYE